jgi:NADH-quinone oxidoreductase subunit F
MAVLPNVLTTRLSAHADSHTFERYSATGGYKALRKAITSMTPAEVHEEVKAANIMGRGGFIIPAGVKWGLMREGGPRYIVVNGDEGEPCTFKDHLLVERDPHQLVEGVLLTAYAVGAHLGFIYLRGEFALGLERVQAAIDEAYANGMAGANLFGTGVSIDLVAHPGAGAYICGDETALIESLEGKKGFPRLKPPNFPAVFGLYNQPTVVNNLETLSNIPWIVENGGAKYAEMGGEGSTGTRLVCLAGQVKSPGTYEIELHKTTFRDLIFDPTIGGGMRDGREMRFFIPGGSSAPWFGPEHLDVPYSKAGMDAARGVLPDGGSSMLGSGSIIAMDETACPVRVAWRLTKFYAHESCGQCTPCREGGSWLEKTLRRIETGAGREDDVKTIMDVCRGIVPRLAWPPNQTTICPLGPSIPMPIVSAIQMFPEDFERHVAEHRCPYVGSETR